MGIAKDKLTDAQKQEVERLRQFVSRNRLDVKMNSTKWRAAIDAVLAVEGYLPRYRLRLVTDPADPPEGVWRDGFPQGLPLYNAIEWLELDPRGAAPLPGAAGKGRRPDFRRVLTETLAAAGIPVADLPGGIRIVAHTRPPGKT